MATVTNYEERLTTALEGLVMANGGDLPTRNSVNSDQEYRLKLAEAVADGAVGGATFTIGAEVSNVIKVTIQLTDVSIPNGILSWLEPSPSTFIKLGFSLFQFLMGF